MIDTKTSPQSELPRMQSKILGRTGLEVSIVGLGAAFLGVQDASAAPRLYQNGESHLMEEELGQATVIAALEAGCTLIDTAALYGDRRSEMIIGKALGRRQDLASNCLVTTKVGRNYLDKYDFTADGIRRSLETSQRLLGIGKFRLVYIHDPMGFPMNDIMGPGGALEGLRQCQKDGTVDYVGIAANEPTTNATYIETGEFDAAVVPEAFSLLNQLAFNRIFPSAQRHNVGLVGATPLERGILATGPIDGMHYLDRKFDTATIQKVRNIQALCNEYSVPMNAVALQWCTRNPLVASTVPGARTPEEARSNSIAGTIQVPEQLWHKLVSVI